MYTVVWFGLVGTEDGVQASSARALPLNHTSALHWGILGRGTTAESCPQPSLGDSRQALPTEPPHCLYSFSY